MILVIMVIFYYILNKLFVITISSDDKVVNIPAFNDSFSIIFIHSSEKQPWENIFKVDKDLIVLKTMKVAAIGPGVPSNAEEGWIVKIKDGFIIYDNINKKYKYLDLKVSEISPHYLKIGNKKYNLVKMFQDNECIRIRAKKIIF
ncbi:MAG: DUF1850 domain-containing protein [Thermovenabulum sp.]|uniref:DUF1850 domain-containing protein n=1 Tax=Thermovenabulum sp. TaxID=3100335 RepID=UPI003C7C4ECC